MKKEKPIFLFDFDGVIVDTLEEVYLTFCLFFKKIGLKPLTKEEVRLMYRKNIYQSLKEKGILKKYFSVLYDLIKEREKARKNKVFIYQGIDLLLKTFSGHRLFIITSSSTKAVEAFLKRKKLKTYFQKVLGAEKETSKVEKIKTILKEEKTIPSHAYLVTDTVGDILEGKKTGVKTIAITWGYHRKNELKKVKPDYLFNNPKEFIKAIPCL